MKLYAYSYESIIETEWGKERWDTKEECIEDTLIDTFGRDAVDVPEWEMIISPTSFDEFFSRKDTEKYPQEELREKYEQIRG